MATETSAAGTDTYIVEPTKSHNYTVILLHGLGSNGEKFGKELLETGVTSAGTSLTDLLPTARFVFPTSRRRRSSAFKRSILTQWFDIARLSDPSFRKEVQLQGLSESVGDIMDLIQIELERVPAKNIILGGLSQGCATSMAVLLCLQQPLGGYIGMSGYLTFQSDLELAVAEDNQGDDSDDPFSRESQSNKPEESVVKAQAFERDLLGLSASQNTGKDDTSYSTPIFLGHGEKDEKVPYTLGVQMAEVMRAAQYQVEWKRYEDQGHWYKIPDEIDDLVEFIKTFVHWELEEQTMAVSS